ncbi:MAG: hypothetical protein GW778_00450 [Alphaproteobacteria bacterium]|nr:hypothetical protein [Alphaproteobacteria bacterium]
MIHFTPTLGIKDTAKNVNHFIKENMEVFWDVFKPLIPYIVALHLFDIVITNFFMPIDAKSGERIDFTLGGLIAGYFYTCLAITWHRVVIHGPDNFTPMNPFKPKKSELAFIGMGIALFAGIFVGGFIFGLLAAIINPFLLILIIPFIFFATYAWLKCMFYFPSKATGNTITLKQSFEMTKGYMWKMYAAYIVAFIKLFLILIGLVIVMGMAVAALGFASAKLGLNESLTMSVVQTMFVIPLTVFFQPIFTIIWVTVLSNYYQYVLQNGVKSDYDER